MQTTPARDSNHREQLKCGQRTLATRLSWLVITLATSLSPTLPTSAALAPQLLPTPAVVAPQFSEPVVTERGPNHRVWTKSAVVAGPDGRTRTNTTSVTEIANGLHYLKDGQWVESREQFQLIPGAAVANEARHQVQLAHNINSAGAIQLLTPDGRRLRSHILGLSYTDAASGKSTMFATIKDSIGELAAQNQVVYRDAFTDVKADVRYTFTKAGLEQDVIPELLT